MLRLYLTTSKRIDIRSKALQVSCKLSISLFCLYVAVIFVAQFVGGFAHIRGLSGQAVATCVLPSPPLAFIQLSGWCEGVT